MRSPRTAGVDDDLPPDVVTTLAQLLEETQVALSDGDVDTARETISSAESVAADELPDCEVRQSLLHGAGRVTALLDPDSEDGVESDAAAEYAAAMSRRLPDAD